MTAVTEQSSLATNGERHAARRSAGMTRRSATRRFARTRAKISSAAAKRSTPRSPPAVAREPTENWCRVLTGGRGLARTRQRLRRAPGRSADRARTREPVLWFEHPRAGEVRVLAHPPSSWATTPRSPASPRSGTRTSTRSAAAASTTPPARRPASLPPVLYMPPTSAYPPLPLVAGAVALRRTIERCRVPYAPLRDVGR
jgi:hypothetical protein